MPGELQSAKVVRVSLDEPLAPIEVEERHGRALLIVTLGGTVLGELMLPAREVLGIEAQREAVSRELGEQIWKERLTADFTRAARGPARPEPMPNVSVVVCAGAATPGLTALLDSLLALDPPAQELIVVGSDDPVRVLCADYPVRYLEEPLPGLSRARNRGVAEASGDVVAFVEDGYVVDPHWLDGLARDFQDRLVMAVKGYTGPLELETRAQFLFQRHESHGRSLEPRTYDRIVLEEPRLAEGNCFFRREAFVRAGPFAEFLGPGTATRAGHESELQHRLVAAGWRVAFRPSHIAWRRPPRDLRGALFSEALGAQAWTTYHLLARGDLSVLAPAPSRWSRGLLPTRALGRLAGPWALLRSRLARRRVEPIAVDGRRSTVDGRESTVVSEADPHLSVAVASYNRREPLARLLEVFAEQSYPPDRFEVVVVLDGSTDGSAERVRALDLPYRLRLLEQENRGLAASRNRGAREASAPVVVFIDDDMAPVRDFLAEHAGAHRRASAPSVVLGPCPPDNPGRDHASLALRHWWADYYRRRAEPDHKWTYTDFGDGNVSFPRPILDACSGWDEEFSQEAVRRQDWELGIRLLKSGVPFVDCPGAVCWHRFDVSLATSVRNRRVEGRGDVLLGMKHPSVKEHLFLRRFIVDEHGRPRQYRLLADHPAASARLVQLGSRSARMLETMQVRWVAWKAMLRLLSYSYLLGVRETLPTAERFHEFVAPMLRHELAETVPVELDRPGPLDVPAAIGAIDLLIGYAGRELARVDALEPEVQWDWDTLTDRVVREALDPYRTVVGGLPGAHSGPIPEPAVAERSR